jgi:cytochrome-b5 reductase
MDATVAVTAVHQVGPDAVAVEFDSPDGFDARPGQFVRLSAAVDGEEYSRFYTLSSPTTDGTFEVTIGYDPDEGGPFSRRLLELDSGETFEMAGPYGDAAYDDDARSVVLAGGPGVGAAVGIAERALADGNEAAVVYRDDDPAHTDRLDQLRAAGATVHVTDGDVVDHVADVLTGAAGETVFVYGFADFVEAAREAIAAAGGDPDAALVESFG